MNQATGKYLLVSGAIIVLFGIIIYFFHDSFKWLGRLPGDVRIEKKNFRFYFPFVTMIIVSIFITLVINVIRKFF